MISERIKKLTTFCPYTHLWRIARSAVATRKLPESVKPGAYIALLGFFCPLFWTAYFTGADDTVLFFHATHSGVVFGIGILLMIVGLRKEKKRYRQGSQ